MKTIKLSERAQLLLFFVDQATERDWSTMKLSRFFYPQSGMYHYSIDGGRREFTYISGSGDANALKGLARKGLIERPKTTLANDYAYALTESGLQWVVANELRERFGV